MAIRYPVTLSAAGNGAFSNINFTITDTSGADSNHTNYATCWFGGVILNVLVGMFIAGGRPGHWLQADPAPDQNAS